ncbi:MAG: WG repeat-containing protein [Bacteroidales bacterium]
MKQNIKKIYIITLLLLLFPTVFNGQMINNTKWIRSIYSNIQRPYEHGYSAFFNDGKWGFLNKNGTVIISPQFEEVSDFNEYGLARVKNNGKWGVIDNEGNYKFKCIYTQIGEFSSQMALANDGTSQYYLNIFGNTQQLSDKYTYSNFSDGMAKVSYKDKWGYINTKGTLVISPEYAEAYDFSGGYAVVSNGETRSLINKKGNKKIIDESLLKEPLVFKDGLALVNKGGYYSYIGEDLIENNIRYNMASDYSEGLASAKFSNGSIMCIDTKGNSLFNVNVDELGPFSEGKAWVKKGNRYGYIDKTGKIIATPIFTYASNFNNGIAYVATENKKGIIKVKELGDKFPYLEMSSAILADEDMNHTVETEEKLEIKCKLSNKGDETLKGVNIKLNGLAEQLEWFNFDSMQILIDSIKVGCDTIITFSGASKTNLVSEEIQMQINVDANNMLSQAQEQLNFKAMGVIGSKPIISRYWVYKTGHAAIEKGDLVNFELYVMNGGKDFAKDVKVNIIWPKGVSGTTNQLIASKISPGEEVKLTTTFIIDSLIQNLKNLSIVASLSEFTKKHTDVQYLTFEVSKMNPPVNVLTSTTYQPSIGQNFAQNKINAYQNEEIQANAYSKDLDSELLAGLTKLNNEMPNRYALVIGNEDYNSFKQTVSYEQNVDYATQDATAFANYAKNIMGVPENNVILLKNATYSQMNFNLNKLIRISVTNPRTVELYIYYAGHGQHDADTKETYLIPVDVSIATPSAGIKLEQMYANLSNAQSKRTIVFLDACYSGVGRGIVIKPKEAPVRGNLFVITASSSSQRSMPYNEKKHGMFTYFLLKQIKEAQGNIKMVDLFNKVKTNVQKNSIWINNSEQIPEMIIGEDISKDATTWKLY